MRSGWYNDSYRHSLASRGVSTAMRSKYKIPPAWKDVKLHKDKAYIATGVDAKGRLQYIYPKSHVARQSEKKYGRVERLEKQAPAIIESVKQDIAKENNPEAEVVYTIYKTAFRPGTEKDTMADQKAYGASSLLRRQVKVKGDKVTFKFIGKKGVQINKTVRDKLLAKIMKGRKSGDRVFDTSDSQLNSYFKKKTDGRYTLKDLRTLRAHQIAKKGGGDKKVIGQRVSAELGNTPAVAVKSYVDPELLSDD